MKRIKRIFIFALAGTLVSGCGISLETAAQVKEDKYLHREEKSVTKTSEQDLGYPLSVNREQKEEAEADCRAVMQMVREIYIQADRKESGSTSISSEAAKQIVKKLQTTGRPVGADWFHINMCNYEKFESFLEDCLNGKRAEIIMYEVYANGSIGRIKFTFDGTDMYALSTSTAWSEENTPVMLFTSYSRLKKWEYTQKGWFIFKYCVPEPPQVSERINENAMIRVKPLDESYVEIAKKYLFSVGYMGNNLFCSNWDEAHMEAIDYNALFQYFYSIKHQKAFFSGVYTEGIPKQEFEDLITEYLPVTSEQLEQYAVYDIEKQTYGWARLGCGNYVPNAFESSSRPEIVGLIENADGTVTLTIDAVCERAGSDCVMTHELTVQFTEDGGIRYLKNQILGDGLKKITEYQYRLGNRR
ncbi:MAG: DUF6070 family protein [Eubacteriales bacterium]|nr:DUF6070 family protein [Eubacteriales bacterium]